MDNLTMTRQIAETVKAFRQARQMTQTDLARQVGISKSTVSRIEDGNEAKLENLVKIAQHFGIRVDDLFNAHFEVCPRCEGLGILKIKRSTPEGQS